MQTMKRINVLVPSRRHVLIPTAIVPVIYQILKIAGLYGFHQAFEQEV